MSTTDDTHATCRGSECNDLLGLVPEQAIRDIANGLNGVQPMLSQWQRDLRLARAVEAAARQRISALVEAHTGIRLSTVEYLEMMRQGPTPQEWAELDANAKA